MRLNIAKISARELISSSEFCFACGSARRSERGYCRSRIMSRLRSLRGLERSA
jgi:hypothetical protein